MPRKHDASLAEKYHENFEIVKDKNYGLLKDHVNSKMSDTIEFRIPSVTGEYVLKQLKQLNITGNDRLSPRILSIAAPAIASPLTKIFNLSIPF